jgi:cell division septal protein FtsQ
VPPEEVYAESGLAGQHIFWVDPAAAAERIAAIPGIAAAQVTVAWPAHVTVVVEERVPQVILLEGGQKWWVDSQGREFKARGNLPGMLPIESQDGQALEGLPPAAVAGALQLKQLRGNIEKLYYEPARGLSYQDGRGWRGYFGVGLDMAEKLAVYERLVDDLMSQGVYPREISVENVRAPVYKK